MASQKPATLNLCRTRGDTFPFTVVISQDGSVVDITGYTIIMTVDPSNEPADALNNLFSVTATVPTGTDGRAVFTLTAPNADQTPGEYFHDMQLTDGGGNIRTFARGTYLIEQDIGK
jgi:hypothetical protein